MASEGSKEASVEKHICVIGAGVTGLGAAWHLKKNSASTNISVTVLEQSEFAGGHARTVDVQLKSESRTVPVDVGFMVYNHQNYPNLVGLFNELGVEGENSEMSFSVSLNGGYFEWGSSTLSALFACKFNIFRPSFYRMLRDMIRFNREAPKLLLLDDQDPRKVVTVGEYLKINGYSDSFFESYLQPMTAALWSSSGTDVMNFSALTLISFFHNHSMLQIFKRPQWKTPLGRSKKYVDKITKFLGNSLELNNGAKSVSKSKEGLWSVVDSKGNARNFHQVIFACHADQALNLLGEHSTEFEREYLGEFKFAENVAYIHSDSALMPHRRATWSSWNYIGEETRNNKQNASKPVYVTYWLNRLQNLDCSENIFVSLNPHAIPSKEKTHHVIKTTHPQFTPSAELSQRRMSAQNGIQGLWFCGAYMGYGFHEDGLRSGLEAACRINSKPVPWASEKALFAKKPQAESLNGKVENSIGGGIFMRMFIGLFFHSILAFLRSTIKIGRLAIICPDKREFSFGESTPTDNPMIRIQIFDWWFFVRVALEYDLGLARSYLAGEWAIENDTKYADGLRSLFLLFISNRDSTKSRMSYSGLFTSWIGYTVNFVRYRLKMDNSLSGSRSNIHAHYDLSNDLFTAFLDTELMMYSSAIYESKLEYLPKDTNFYNIDGKMGQLKDELKRENSLVFRGTLEEAQIRKVDTLIARARIQKSHKLLDIGFGWGGIAIRAAQIIGCKVHGITLSKEQKALAEKRVKEAGLSHLITFELIDYREFANIHLGEFDRIISCEMIEAVGHNYLPTFFEAIEKLLAPNGIFVMEAITTPESRYKEYLRSTDFINTIIFPGSCCPSFAALISAMESRSSLSLDGYENIGMHYAKTLQDWRYRFNDNYGNIKKMGFDDVFRRCWNYYFCYCEAGFDSQTEGCLILTFSRPGNRALLVDSESHRIIAKN